jgi:hypothetical protein
MTAIPELDDVERVLKHISQTTTAAETETVSVTVNSRYQLINATVNLAGLSDAQRASLEGDIIKAVNEAMQAAVVAAARALNELPPPPEIDALKAAMHLVRGEPLLGLWSELG